VSQQHITCQARSLFAHTVNTEAEQTLKESAIAFGHRLSGTLHKDEVTKKASIKTAF